MFHADGHGSVRVLADLTAAVLQQYVYDAYGVLLNMQASAALTSYLYSGEQFDTNIGLQYLRARYYDAHTGLFTRLDPFFGNLQDPQSFHKYLYTHANPINGVDPSGENFSLGGALVGVTIGVTIASIDSHIAKDSAEDAFTKKIVAGLLGGVTGGLAVPIFLVLPTYSVATQLAVLATFAFQILYSTRLGVDDAILRGNPELATFRQTVGFLSLVLLPFASRPGHYEAVNIRLSTPRVGPLPKSHIRRLWGALPRRQNAYPLRNDPGAGSLVGNGRQRLTESLPDGVYKYVVDKAHRVWVVDVASDSPHSALVPRGDYVYGAGYINKSGSIANANPRSGHYMQENPLLGNDVPAYNVALRETFLRHGIKLKEFSNDIRPIRSPGSE